MRFLLDSHFVVWWLGANPKLGKTQLLIERSDCAVSVASLIELRMKAISGKLKMPRDESAHLQLITEGFAIIGIMAEHVEVSARYENSHADMFDRLLLATAQVERRILLTRDEALLALAKKARLDFVAEG